MAEVGLVQLRRVLDEAMTFADWEFAQELVQEGCRISQEKNLKGELYYFSAQKSIMDEDYTKAIEQLDHAITANPQDGASYNDLALCMVELGQAQEAWAYFDKGIEVEPDYATIHHNKGWLLNQQGRSHEAIESFERALALEPGRAVTYENLAHALLKTGQKNEATLAYQKAIEFLKTSHVHVRKQIEQYLIELTKK